MRLPRSALLGEKGEGFGMVMAKLAHERLTQAVRSAVAIETMLSWTSDYVSQREAFGRRLADFQNTRFTIADLKARSTMVRVFTDKCVSLFMDGGLDPVDAAMVKLVTAELHCEAADKCLQLFGGWGYMRESPICRAFADARIVKIAGGSVEIMKTIIARNVLN